MAGEVDDAFGEWDERAAVPAGSQPAALPTASRTATRTEPRTTGALAEVARRPRPQDAVRATSSVETPRPRRTMEVPPASLEEALLAFTGDVSLAGASGDEDAAGAAAHDHLAPRRSAYRAAR